MPLADIREQVRAILTSVEGVGVVHDYLRLTHDRDKFLLRFQDSEDGRIRSWMITRRSTQTERDLIQMLRLTHEFRIVGVYGLKDAEGSEIEFQDLVERVQDAFGANNLLNGTVIDSEPIQVDVIEPRMFGSVLCHYAQLTLRAHERRRYQ